jgi:hypothetical protein
MIGRSRKEKDPCNYFDFWTERRDPEQEQLRQALVRRLTAIIPADDPLATALNDWCPSSAAACRPNPSSEYFAWRHHEKGLGE